MSELSLIVPCYNEAARFKPSVWLEAIETWPWLQLIVIDDGSTDATSAILARLTAARPDRVRHLALAKNAGKGEAVRHALRAALDSDASFTGFWDADLATPLDELPRLRDALLADDRREMVLGSRVKMLGTHIERNAWRHWLGRLAATLASEWLDLPVYDTQCGAKLFRTTPSFRAVLSEPFLTRWAFDVELLCRWRRLHPELSDDALGEIMIELPLRTWREIKGTNIRLKDVLLTPLDLLRIRAQLQPGSQLVQRLGRSQPLLRDTHEKERH